MYLEDFHAFDNYIFASNPTMKLLAVGWLDKEHKFPTGQTSPEFQQKLLVFCQNPGYITLGFHDCEFCDTPQPDKITIPHPKYSSTKLGSTEIMIIGQNDRSYHAPDLIYHYIRDHNYLPPAEFIEAVMSVAAPDSEEYAQTMAQFEYQPECVEGICCEVKEVSELVSIIFPQEYYLAFTLFEGIQNQDIYVKRDLVGELSEAKQMIGKKFRIPFERYGLPIKRNGVYEEQILLRATKKPKEIE
jgi:hypothetical protein